MKARCGFVFAAVAAAAALPLWAGVDLVTSEACSGIRLDTSGLPTVVSSQTDIANLVDWPVTYRKGETVTATAPGGGTTELVASAESDGSAAFAPTSGGLWRLENSSGETALVGVSWNVFNDGWALDFASTEPFRMDTKDSGPNRKGHWRKLLPIAYSGDGWIGDAAATSTLTYTSPKGEVTAREFAGTGADLFSLYCGTWTVRLDMGNGTSCVAEISSTGGFALIFR